MSYIHLPSLKALTSVVWAREAKENKLLSWFPNISAPRLASSIDPTKKKHDREIE